MSWNDTASTAVELQSAQHFADFASASCCSLPRDRSLPLLCFLAVLLIFPPDWDITSQAHHDTEFGPRLGVPGWAWAASLYQVAGGGRNG